MIGTGACGVATILYEYRLLTRHITERLPWADRGRAALAMIPGLIPAWFIAPHFGIFGVLVAGAVFLGCYVLLMSHFRPLTLDPDMLESVPRLARRGSCGSAPPPPGRRPARPGARRAARPRSLGAAPLGERVRRLKLGGSGRRREPARRSGPAGQARVRTAS